MDLELISMPDESDRAARAMDCIAQVLGYVGATALLAAASVVAYFVHQLIDPIWFWIGLCALAVVIAGWLILPARYRSIYLPLNRPRKN